MSSIDMDLVDLDSWLHYEQGIWKRSFLRKSSAVYGGFGLRPKSGDQQKSVQFSGNDSFPKNDTLRRDTRSRASTHSSSFKTECRRVTQLQQPSNKALFVRVPSGRSQRSTPTSSDQPLVPWVSSPCCVISRSREKIHALLRETNLSNVTQVSAAPEDESSKVSEKTSKWTEMMENLLDQIDNLTLSLEEEKLNHNETKRQAVKNLENSLAELNETHNAAMRRLMSENEERQIKLKNEHDAEKNLMKTHSDDVIKKLERDIALSKAAFVTYREQLNFDSNEKLNARLRELEQTNEETIKKRLFDLKVKMIADQNSELASMTKQHDDQLSRLRKDQKRQLKEVKHRFSENYADLEELKETRLHLRELQDEMNKATDLQRNTMLQLDEERMKSKELELNLLTCTLTLEDRASQIDLKYRVNQDKLSQEIADLRMLHMKTCNEYENEKIECDAKVGRRIKSAKDAIKVVIEARNRTAISLVSPPSVVSVLDASSVGEELRLRTNRRPTSCPSTKQEKKAAQIFSGQTDRLTI